MGPGEVEVQPVNPGKPPSLFHYPAFFRCSHHVMAIITLTPFPGSGEIPAPVPAQFSPPLSCPLLYPGPEGAPSTGPRPASSTPRMQGSLRHTAGTGEFRRQRPVLSLSRSLISMPPRPPPRAAVINSSGAGLGSRFPRAPE